MISSSWVVRELPIKVVGDLFGYRWVTDTCFQSIYIVKIKINKYYYKKPYGKELDYLAEDWTIIEIYDAINHKNVDRIPGRTQAHYLNHTEYFVGNHITDEEVYFCLSIQDLAASQYRMMKSIEKICLMNDENKKMALDLVKHNVFPEWIEEN